MLNMDRIPSSAAVNTTVELAKRSELANLSSVVNGILRAVVRAKKAGEELPLPLSPVARLAQIHSFPL